MLNKQEKNNYYSEANIQEINKDFSISSIKTMADEINIAVNSSLNKPDSPGKKDVAVKFLSSYDDSSLILTYVSLQEVAEGTISETDLEEAGIRREDFDFLRLSLESVLNEKKLLEL